jgi:hypothetical protein
MDGNGVPVPDAFRAALLEAMERRQQQDAAMSDTDNDE